MKSRAFAVLLAAAGAAGCGSRTPSEPNPAPTAPAATTPAVAAPTPAPTPTPSPAPRVTGPSDVSYLGLFNYLKCQPKRAFVISRGCRYIEATATPKKANGDNANQHGKNLVWRVNGVVIPDDANGIDAGCVLVAAGPQEFTFNRVFHRKSDAPCTAVVEAKLWDPQANEHGAQVTLVVE